MPRPNLSPDMTVASPADTLLVVEFSEPMTLKQQLWLRTTRASIRHVTFHVNDNASAALLHSPSTLVGSRFDGCRTALASQCVDC